MKMFSSHNKYIYSSKRHIFGTNVLATRKPLASKTFKKKHTINTITQTDHLFTLDLSNLLKKKIK